MNKLGLYFRKEKLEALFRGDTSNTVVNRYFVYGLQAIGTHICGTPEVTPAMTLLQARYAQLNFEAFIEINRTDDYKLRAQGFILFVHGCILTGFQMSAQLYLSRLCQIIDKGKLQFLSACGRPAGLSEQVREDAAVLSQVIYLYNYLNLTSSGSTSLTMARIEKEFRLDLEVSVVR